MIDSNGSPPSGAVRGSRAAISPGSTRARTGRSETVSRYPDTQDAASASASRSSSLVGPGPVIDALMGAVWQRSAAVDRRGGRVVDREVPAVAEDRGRPQEAAAALVDRVDGARAGRVQVHQLDLHALQRLADVDHRRAVDGRVEVAVDLGGARRADARAVDSVDRYRAAAGGGAVVHSARE